MPLATTGACLAVLWETGPAVALLALGPIALVYRALLVPQLEHRARTDPKTGLYNFAHFSAQMEQPSRTREAGRQAGPRGVDLDHLREINNRFGHLVGDRVILGVAEALASTGAPNATAARFGGEEFCLLLPGASLEEATVCACALAADCQEPGGKVILLQPGQPLTDGRRDRLRLGFSGDQSDSPDCLMDRVVFDVQSHWYLSTYLMVPLTDAAMRIQHRRIAPGRTR